MLCAVIFASPVKVDSGVATHDMAVHTDLLIAGLILIGQLSKEGKRGLRLASLFSISLKYETNYPAD